MDKRVKAAAFAGLLLIASPPLLSSSQAQELKRTDMVVVKTSEEFRFDAKPNQSGYRIDGELHIGSSGRACIITISEKVPGEKAERNVGFFHERFLIGLVLSLRRGDIPEKSRIFPYVYRLKNIIEDACLYNGTDFDITVRLSAPKMSAPKTEDIITEGKLHPLSAARR